MKRGQWYIIAGVLISFSLITFFHIYYSYSTIDLTSILKNREDNYALNILFALNKTRTNSPLDENKLADTGELLEMFKNSLEGRGYLVSYSYNTSAVESNISGKAMEIKIKQ